MDRAFIEDYTRREASEIHRYHDTVHGTPEADQPEYPPRGRFPKIAATRVWAKQQKMGVNIWPQVPGAGTLIISLVPVEESHFEFFNGFNPHEIPQVTQFARETGRIAFVLGAEPMRFQGLDYLSPIFQDLRPPLLLGRSPLDPIRLAKHRLIYSLAAQNHYIKLNSELGDPKFDFNMLLSAQSEIYATLRLSGFHDIADDALRSVKDDPERAHDLIAMAGIFLVSPGRYSFRSTQSVSLDDLHRGRRLLGKERAAGGARFPAEIGSFLMGKLTHYPTSMDACKALIERYDAVDYYRLLAALDDHVRWNNFEGIPESAGALAEALDSAWDAGRRIGAAKSYVEGGMGFGIGAVGLWVGGLPGLLALLGIALDRVGPKIAEKSADSVVRAFAAPYSMQIYDFHRKYGLAPAAR